MLIFVFQYNEVFAQTTYQLPPNQPEQDACHALQLCGNTFYSPYSYTGTGQQLDLSESPCKNGTGAGEVNSVWLKVHIAQAGTVVFTLKPNDPQDDYDFVVINATGNLCGPFTKPNVVRCNYDLNTPGSNANGLIGLSDTTRTPYIVSGTYGRPYAQAVYASSGDVYLIMINNYGNYVTGGPSKGFTINFDGSTAIFEGPALSQLSSVNVPCNNANSVIVKTSADILCSSIAADGSDFSSDASASIISASGINCSSNGGYTNLVQINFSALVNPGQYTLSLKRGNDNNSLLDLCGNELSSTVNAIPFIVKVNAKEIVDNENICFQQLPYRWNGTIINNGGDSVAKYVTQSSQGCDSTTYLNLHVSPAPTSKNISGTICDGGAYVLPWDSTVTKSGTYLHHYTNINGCDSLVETVNLTVITPPGGDAQQRDSTYQTGFCENGSIRLVPYGKFVNYSWNTGEKDSTIIVNVAGAYSLIAIDQYGCITIDTFVVAAYQYPTADFHTTENLCKNGKLTLRAGDKYISYLWNNGSVNDSLTVNTPGVYWVTLTSVDNCTATDTVHVVSSPLPSNFLQQSITKCSFKSVSLSPSGNFLFYNWSNGNRDPSVKVIDGGWYWLDVTDFNGCVGRDSIKVIDSLCPEYFYLPSAFTPNGDGRNDIFKPFFSGSVTGYHLMIYDRWGAKVFESKNPTEGWDGTYKSFPQPLGVYLWMCHYSLDGKLFKNEKGTITLLR